MNPQELAKDGAEGVKSATGRRIVLATFGSLGICTGSSLWPRSYRPGPWCRCSRPASITASGSSAGDRVVPVRPDLLDLEGKPEFFRDLMDRKKGSEVVIRQVFMPPCEPATTTCARRSGAPTSRPRTR